MLTHLILWAYLQIFFRVEVWEIGFLIWDWQHGCLWNMKIFKGLLVVMRCTFEKWPLNVWFSDPQWFFNRMIHSFPVTVFPASKFGPSFVPSLGLRRKLYIHRIPQRDDAFGALTQIWAKLPEATFVKWSSGRFEDQDFMTLTTSFGIYFLKATMCYAKSYFWHFRQNRSLSHVSEGEWASKWETNLIWAAVLIKQLRNIIKHAWECHFINLYI